MRTILAVCAAAAAVWGAAGCAIHADCPDGNCPANTGAAGPDYSGGYYYYPGWSWGNPYGWAWGYQRPGRDHGTDARNKPEAKAESPAEPDEEGEPAETAEPAKDKEGANEMERNDTAALIETIEAETAAPAAEKKNHLVFGRKPGVPDRNEFVLIDRQGQCLAKIKLFWKDPKKKDEIGVSVTDADVDGIKTWRKELWDKILEGMEEEE